MENKSSNNLDTNILLRINRLKSIINKTISACQKYKLWDILGANEINVCINTLDTLFKDINLEIDKLNQSKNNIVEISTKINKIQEEIILIIKNFGTESLDDLIYLLFDDNYIDNIKNENLLDKYHVLMKCSHPINYKIIPWKQDITPTKKKVIQKNKIIEDSMICESGVILDCYDLARTSKSFQTKVYGIKLCLHDFINRKTYLVACFIDDMLLTCLESEFITDKINYLHKNKPKDIEYKLDYWTRYIMSLTIKDLLVYSISELTQKFISIINQLLLLKQKTISQVVKEFLNNELYSQRTLLIQLLIQGNEEDFQYLAYLLYDLLSNESNGAIDTVEQTLLYDSLPWNIKKFFKIAMQQTIEYTNTLCNYDSDKIPLEQQICLLKANDNVKEKAILKLKEIKAKSEDTGSKARQYLDGLLKIPFSIIREEPILNIIDNNQQIFLNIIDQIKSNTIKFDFEIEKKQKYTNREIQKYIAIIKNMYISKLSLISYTVIENNLKKLKKDDTINIILLINNLIKNNKLSDNKIIYSNKKLSIIQQEIIEFLKKNANSYDIMNSICINLDKIVTCDNHNSYIKHINKQINTLENNIVKVEKYMFQTTEVLNNAVHGHEKAKRQVERIIGQWINGDKSGYCFGFEGPPGVGKTSLAKRGLAQCLKDENGIDRPFAFIAIGGSANGSTLEGHNYTYVGSTWGRIVDILIESKCMNPIIFIDELDKISKTEHGKEIIGILTHLIDPTQNDTFQDKYFSGIDLDLSKALFIFSYNDVDNIDKILLDRIHRIKFKHLVLEEKLVITNNYILPEIYKKMGLDNIIEIENNVIEYIINNYTKEPGVRKLKEILFEIIGEINLTELAIKDNNITYPIKITIEDIKYKYLKDRHEFKIKQIFNEHKVAVISGLWANNYGQGGLLPIEAKYLPSSQFLDLKLTGMQGDVMKESMNVARTLAWNLLSESLQIELLEKFEKTKCQGIHIHVPEGATPKDGPSGGAAITTVIYSLLSGRKINRTFAMTGEICLQGRITAIGGLDLKILGGIESGITNFIYPKENDKDFKEFETNLKNKSILTNINFFTVSSIKEIFDIIFVD